MPEPTLRNPTSVYVYNDKDGARGCGHTGFVFFYADSSAERIYQSAANPGDAAWKLVLLKHPMVVVIDPFKNAQRIRQIIGKAQYFQLVTEHASELRAAIDAYIGKNPSYSSLTNNCAHFMHEVIQSATPDIATSRKLIPNRYFRRLKELNLKNKKNQTKPKKVIS